MNIRIVLKEGGRMPEFSRDGDACADCHALTAGGRISVPDGSRCLVGLGFSVEIPEGFEGLIRPRSGLSSRGVDVALGTIDPAYRGEVKACVINNSGGPFDIYDGDRICQLAVRRTESAVFVPAESLTETERGSDGFGSSGM